MSNTMVAQRVAPICVAKKESADVWTELHASLAIIGMQLHAQSVLLISKRDGRDAVSHVTWRCASAGSGAEVAIVGSRIIETLEPYLGREWTVEIERAAGAQAFSETETLFACQLLCLFKSTFAIWTCLQLKQRRLSAFEALVNTAAHAVMLVNSNSQILFANHKAEALLQEGAVFIRSDRRLTATQYSEAMRLQAALQFALSREFGDGHANVIAPLLKMGRVDGSPLLVAILPVRRSERAQRDAMAAIYIVDPARDLNEPVTHICRLHGLTRTETRLASHLAGGRSVLDSAELMMIRPQTARGYLKQIFLKLGITRQADLVRLLITHIVPLRAEFVSVGH